MTSQPFPSVKDINHLRDRLRSHPEVFEIESFCRSHGHSYDPFSVPSSMDDVDNNIKTYTSAFYQQPCPVPPISTWKEMTLRNGVEVGNAGKVAVSGLPGMSSLILSSIAEEKHHQSSLLVLNSLTSSINVPTSTDTNRAFRPIFNEPTKSMTLQIALDARNVVTHILSRHGSASFAALWDESGSPEYGFWRHIRRRFKACMGEDEVLKTAEGEKENVEKEPCERDKEAIACVFIDVMVMILEFDLAQNIYNPMSSLAFRFLGDRKFSTFLNDRQVSFLESLVLAPFRSAVDEVTVDLVKGGLSLRLLHVYTILCYATASTVNPVSLDSLLQPLSSYLVSMPSNPQLAFLTNIKSPCFRFNLIKTILINQRWVTDSDHLERLYRHRPTLSDVVKSLLHVPPKPKSPKTSRSKKRRPGEELQVYLLVVESVKMVRMAVEAFLEARGMELKSGEWVLGITREEGRWVCEVGCEEMKREIEEGVDDVQERTEAIDEVVWIQEVVRDWVSGV